jgi:hypothetical protein
VTPAHYEYTIRRGDSLTRIIHDMYGWSPHGQPITYAATRKGVLSLNPHIKDPDRIVAGTILRLPQHPTSVVLNQIRPVILKQQGFISRSLVEPVEKERVTALAWLARNSSWLTTPGSVATGTASALLSPGNRQLLTDLGDLHADYKTKRLTRTAYHARRTEKIDLFRRNIGPLFERMLYPKSDVRGAMRQGINLLPPEITSREVARLMRLARHAVKGGVLLTGIGVTAACLEIAHTVDRTEKNEIFIDTVASTLVGSGFGIVVGIFLVSNPVGWGTAVLLAVGGSVASWGAGKFAHYVYDKHGNEIDFVSGLGIDKVCR